MQSVNTNDDENYEVVYNDHVAHGAKGVYEVECTPLTPSFDDLQQ